MDTKNTHKRGRRAKTVNSGDLLLARQTLQSAYRILRGWDAVAAHFGLSKPAAYRIANDATYRPSQAVVDRLILAPMPQLPLIPVPACPDCGSVHHARCNGHAGQVVVLAQGERVVTQRGAWRSKASPDVAKMVAGLEACLERKKNQRRVKDNQ